MTPLSFFLDKQCSGKDILKNYLTEKH